jgi:hypothetical protein
MPHSRYAHGVLDHSPVIIVTLNRDEMPIMVNGRKMSGQSTCLRVTAPAGLIVLAFFGTKEHAPWNHATKSTDRNMPIRQTGTIRSMRAGKTHA